MNIKYAVVPQNKLIGHLWFKCVCQGGTDRNQRTKGKKKLYLISLVFLKTGLPSFSSPISNRSEYSSLLLWSTWKSAHLSAFTRFFAYICNTRAGKVSHTPAAHSYQTLHCSCNCLFWMGTLNTPFEYEDKNSMQVIQFTSVNQMTWMTCDDATVTRQQNTRNEVSFHRRT